MNTVDRNIRALVTGASSVLGVEFEHLLTAQGDATALNPRNLLAKPRFASTPFTLGVASGDPSADGMVLWTRLLPAEPGAASGPLTVRWEVADDERFLRIVQRGTATALPACASVGASFTSARSMRPVTPVP